MAVLCVWCSVSSLSKPDQSHAIVNGAKHQSICAKSIWSSRKYRADLVSETSVECSRRQGLHEKFKNYNLSPLVYAFSRQIIGQTRSCCLRRGRLINKLQYCNHLPQQRVCVLYRGNGDSRCTLSCRASCCCFMLWSAVLHSRRLPNDAGLIVLSA